MGNISAEAVPGISGTHTGVASVLGVAIITYNRNEYLRELLRALARQRTDQNFEISVLDNGSSVPVAEVVDAELSGHRGPVKVARLERNAPGARALEAVLELGNSEFVCCPGDDDVPRENYVEVLSRLAESSPRISLASAAFETIDSTGAPASISWFPERSTARPILLARLLQRNLYALPTTAFRRDAVDVGRVPGSLTGVDWWLWLQMALSGDAAVSPQVVLDYRIHEGQESRNKFGRSSGAVDGARTLGATISSLQFQQIINGFTRDELDDFARELLAGPGMNGGETQHGPVLELILGDMIAGSLTFDLRQRLYTRASSRLGVIPGLAQLQALDAHQAFERIPIEAWSAWDLAGMGQSTCPLASAWSAVLALPPPTSASRVIEIDCSCTIGLPEHELVFALGTTSAKEEFARTTDFPDRLAVDGLLLCLSEIMGTTSSGTQLNRVEVRVVRTVRAIRSTKISGRIERILRRIWARLSVR